MATQTFSTILLLPRQLSVSIVSVWVRVACSLVAAASPPCHPLPSCVLSHRWHYWVPLWDPIQQAKHQWADILRKHQLDFTKLSVAIYEDVLTRRDSWFFLFFLFRASISAIAITIIANALPSRPSADVKDSPFHFLHCHSTAETMPHSIAHTTKTAMPSSQIRTVSLPGKHESFIYGTRLTF